jgi:hypothetical protein
VRELICEEDRLALEGTHDGFGRHRHVRRFEQTSGALRIVDTIAGPARVARVSFLLHPEVAASVQEAKAQLTRGAATIAFSANVDIRAEAAVWWPDMGEERATTRLVLIAPPGAREITSEFLWSKPDLERGS